MGTCDRRAGTRPTQRCSGVAALVVSLALSACALDAQGPRFTVRVENEQGQPLAGAHVEAGLKHDLLYFGRFEGCMGTVLTRGETGRDGTFRFTGSTRGRHQSSMCFGANVRVTYQDWPDHYSSYSPEVGKYDDLEYEEDFQQVVRPVPTEPDGSTTIRVRLGPATTAHGTVRWLQQPGCEEAPRVIAFEKFDVNEDWPLPTGTTLVRGDKHVDASGAFELGGLGTGQVTVVASYCKRVARHDLPRSATGGLLLDLTSPDSARPPERPALPPFWPR